MADQINHKENKRSLKEKVRDGIIGAAIGAIPGSIAGAFFGYLAYTNTPQAKAASDFYPILISLAAFGATAGAIFGADGIYLEMKEHKQIQREFEKQLIDEWGYIP